MMACDPPPSLEALENAVNTLYFARDNNFPASPLSKSASIKNLQKSILSQIAAFQSAPDTPNTPNTPNLKSILAYLHGATLSIDDTYNPEASSHLQKSVKLNPSGAFCVRGWTLLGVSFWKRGNSMSSSAATWKEGLNFLREAETCFKNAVERCNVEGSASLKDKKQLYRLFSMLMRQLPPSALSEDGSEVAIDVAKCSVEMAKKAVALDVSDGESWYILGNGYVSTFFTGGEKSGNVSTLTMAIKVYDKAESLWQTAEQHQIDSQLVTGCVSPDLYYNRATVHLYMEDYISALKDLENTKKIDPFFSHDVESRIQNDVVGWCSKICGLVKSKGGVVKGEKRLKAVRKEVNKMRLAFEAAREKVSTEGEEKKEKDENNTTTKPTKTVHLKILMGLGESSKTPNSFLVLDGSGECMVLSVYLLSGVGRGVREGDVVTVLEAEVRMVGIPGNVYKNIHVIEPTRTVLINGQAVRRQEIAPTKMRMNNSGYL